MRATSPTSWGQHYPLLAAEWAAQGTWFGKLGLPAKPGGIKLWTAEIRSAVTARPPEWRDCSGQRASGVTGGWGSRGSWK